MTARRAVCPDCGSTDLDAPDVQGWQYCNSCGSDFSPDYVPGMDDGEDERSRNDEW
jgi:ribosomal protein L37AE/L43A